MITNKILFLAIFQCLSFLSFGQLNSDSTFNFHIGEIEGQKFDSVGNLYPIPKFIEKQLKKVCGNNFKILTPELFTKELIRGHREISYNVLHFYLKSPEFYLIYYKKQSDPYSVNYLLICKYEKEKVTYAYAIKNMFCYSTKELFFKLSNKDFTKASLCE